MVGEEVDIICAVDRLRHPKYLVCDWDGVGFFDVHLVKGKIKKIPGLPLRSCESSSISSTLQGDRQPKLDFMATRRTNLQETGTMKHADQLGDDL
jgi:hypothetical protein